MAIEFIRIFLVGYTLSHQPQILSSITDTIPISICKITNMLTPIIKSFVALKVLIQNERT